MFIVTDYGIPYLADSLQTYGTSRLGVIKRDWERSKAWDRASKYILDPVEEIRFSVIQRVLAHTVYDPVVAIQCDWQEVGACNLQEIIAEVELGLESDDDIIQQWFCADDVLTLLRSATTFEEMCDRVECVRGGFEADDRLRNIVVDLLGNEWAEQGGVG